MLWTVIAGATCGACGGWLCRWALRRARPALRLPNRSCELGAAVVCALVTGWLVSRGASVTELLMPLVVATLVVPLTLTDLTHRRLPDVLTLPAYVLLGLALTLTVATGADGAVAGRAAVSTVVFGGLHAVLRFTAPHTIGAGDVKLAGSVGGVLGASGWAALPVGFVVAAVVSMLLTAFVAARGDRHRGVPYGPGLLTGTLVVVVLGWP